jgi:hypothetical protein
MTRSSRDGSPRPPRFGAAFPVAVALAWLLLPAVAAAAAVFVSDDLELNDEDRVCLECHADPALTRRLDDGSTRSVHVSPQWFAASMHANEGCEACHAEIDLDHHGEPHQAVRSELGRLEVMETCRDCHRKPVKQYEDSVHLAMARHGSAEAPLCADCHDPHATRPVDEAAGDPDAMCATCHEPIARAHAASVHGRPGDDRLACKDCHRAHDVKAASFGDHLKDQCLSCHEDVAATHAEWLPNSERHLEAIACAACHSPGTMRRVNLRLYEGGVLHQAAGPLGIPQFVRAADAGDELGLDGRALWSLLQDFSRNGSADRTVVRGRLEVQTGVEAHALADRSQALDDCRTCHRKGAASFQSVTVSMVGPDGRPLHRSASSSVLTSIESIGSVAGFYAIGSTRILLLDILLLMALAGGILVPGAHLAVKLVTARRRAAAAVDRNEQE